MFKNNSLTRTKSFDSLQKQSSRDHLVESSFVSNENKNSYNVKLEKLDSLNERSTRFPKGLLLPEEVQALQTSLDESIRSLSVVAALPYLLENLQVLKNILGRKLVKALLNYDVILQSRQELLLGLKKIQKNVSRLNSANSTKSVVRRHMSREHSLDSIVKSPKESRASSQLERSASQLEMTRNGVEFVDKQLLSSIKAILAIFSENKLLFQQIFENKPVPFNSDVKLIVDILKVNKSYISEMLYSQACEDNDVVIARDNIKMVISKKHMKNDKSDDNAIKLSDKKYIETVSGLQNF